MYDNKAAARFSQLVESNGLQGEIHDYHFIAGLLLAMASAPDMITPSEWLPLIQLDGEMPAFASQEAGQALLTELMLLWNHSVNVLDQDPPLSLPEGCRLEGENPNRELSEFCAGVTWGYDWLEKAWDEFFEIMAESEQVEEMDGIFGATMTSSMLLADPDQTRLLMAEDGVEPIPLDEALEILREGLVIIGTLGKTMAHTFADLEEEEGETEPHVNPMRHVGRNDPCPCGSGKKFKKCCMN